MKIAVVTDDGKTISAHFGRANYYWVATIKDGDIIDQEMRSKTGHHDFVDTQQEGTGHGDEHTHGHGQGHGRGADARNRHDRMFATIADCSVVLARGMGAGAYEGLQEAGIRPIVTTAKEIDGAVRAYIEGRLENHPEKLH